MSNIFSKDKNVNEFKWENLGDIKEGRGELGEEMPVLVYRLMQYTMLDILTQEYGQEKANQYFRDAGYLAGKHFAANTLDVKVELKVFIANLQEVLKETKIGILRMEAHDVQTGEMMLTIGEDLDCSGLPITNETVCDYDEGFIGAILEAYTGNKYVVREVDCWATGARVCRFKCDVKAASAE